MAIHEVHASGLEYLVLATELLQRARLADAEAGVWEAADLQWWWRTPRPSDAIDQIFWIDDDGPVASVVLTDWGRAWGCDPIVVPGISTVPLPTVWARAVEAIDGLGLEAVEGLARDDALELRKLLARAMLTEGLDRLAKRGARRLKVGYSTDVARGLYVGAGFRVTSTTTSYSRRNLDS